MTSSRALNRLKSPLVIVPVVLAVALAFGTFWFLQNYEKKAFEEMRGGSPQARRNPLLAAQKYLQINGRKVISYQGISILSSLPPPEGALFIRRMPRSLGKSVNDKLYSWVRSGGHLLLTPNILQKEGKSSDDILSRLGVRVLKGPDDCGCPSKVKETSKNKTKGKKRKKHVSASQKTPRKKKGYHPYEQVIDFNASGHPIKLRYFGSPLLEDTRDWASFRINGSHRIVYRNDKDKTRKDNNQVKEESGNWLLQYRIGAGKITILSGNTLFTNQSIGKYDHAFFLSWLLDDDKVIRLLYSSHSPGLLALLWARMPYFMVALLLLLVLALWRMQKRSGGYLQPDRDEQLNILSHIEASGLFAWRLNRAETIVAANRKAVLQRWSERTVGTKEGRETEHFAAQSLAGRSGLTEKEVYNAFQEKIEGEQDLIKTSRALQKFHRRLHGGESTRHDG